MSIDYTALGERWELGHEVYQALEKGRPVVLLETALLAFGLPFPNNLQVLLDMERLVYSEGAVPATTAVFGGKVRVGLSAGELEELAQSTQVLKAASLDIGPLLASRGVGATTVSANLLIARRLGIRVLATGGIGGVHRDVLDTFDISSDLSELSRSQVMVVCSGAKSILDVPRTYQMLEMLAVPVVGYRCREFPAFLSISSGLPLHHWADNPKAAAEMALSHWALGSPTAVILANPVPAQHAIEPEQMEQAMAVAIQDEQHQGVAGKEVTPFLLRKLAEITGGNSVEANMALLRANAALAGQVATAMRELTA
jgi:pseudouridine-5'-phosphate glycosidase